MDLLTIDESVRQARATPSGKAGAHITHLLNDNAADVTIQVIGDSTGVPQGGGDNRWVYLLAQYLASAFPAYTVKHFLWNDTNTNYDAATTIQTGSGTGNSGGPFTLNVYNGSKSGATAAYWASKLIAVSPVIQAAPNLVLISNGHNETGQGLWTGSSGTGMNAHMGPLVRAVKAMCANSPVAIVTQNPQNGAGSSSSAAEETNQLLRMAELRRLAAIEGWGLIDVTPAFLGVANYKSNLILADGIHPNTAGSALWAAEVEKHFPLARDRYGESVPSPGTSQHTVWVPAQDLVITSGTPTLTTIQGIPAWSLPAGAVSSVGRAIDFPRHWRALNIGFYWVVATTNTNTWRARPNYGRASGTLRLDSSGSGLTLPTLSVGNLVTCTPNGTANNVRQSLLFTGTNALTGFTGRPIVLQFERTGTDASDTHPNPAFLLGIWLERDA